MNQKNNKERQSKPNPNSDSSAHIQQVSPLAQNRLLSAALSVKEGNELIAKFMGGVKQIIPKGGLHGYKEGTELWMCVFSSNPDPLSYLSFNEEWDWLMPVVEKIENIKDKENCYAFSVDTGRDYCLIYHNDFIQRTISVKSFSGSKIKSVWLAVVEFIKWYNDNAVSVGSR